MTIPEAMQWGRGFLEQHAPQSMTRFIALLCALTGCAVGAASVYLSRRPHITEAEVHMAHELTLCVAAFIGGGAVALLTRSKPDLTKQETA